jgi:hypothetical protein
MNELNPQSSTNELPEQLTNDDITIGKNDNSNKTNNGSIDGTNDNPNETNVETNVGTNKNPNEMDGKTNVGTDIDSNETNIKTTVGTNNNSNEMNGKTIVGAIHELPLQMSTNELSQKLTNNELPQNDNKIQRRKMIVPKIVGFFKMNTAKKINQILNTMGQPVWQRNYYEHIIRDEESLQRIRQYIINNPANWNMDTEYYNEINNGE